MSNFDQKIQSFKAEIAELLKISTNDLDSKDLDEIPNYDSMAKINISLIVEEIFNYKIPLSDLDESKNFSNLVSRLPKKK